MRIFWYAVKSVWHFDDFAHTMAMKYKNILWLIAVVFMAAWLGAANMDPETARAENILQDDAGASRQRLIAHFSTYYKESSDGRKHNIALAASKIDGVTLYPEDEFSFNDCVGSRTAANGFRTAYIIEDGEYIEGIGGGVCQVSSTLYNCALLSGLTVTCVRAHSLQVSYVAPSFDAMVSTASDLRFVNTLSAPVTIRMYADDSYLRAEIYGVDVVTIRRRSETLETLPFDTEYRDDATLPLGEERIDSYGREGLRSEGFLEYFEHGKLVRTVRIRRDAYLPQKRVISRGTMSPADENY